MIRSNKSKKTTIVDEATLSGFALTFTYEVQNGQTKPDSVNMYGNKAGEVVTDPALVVTNINVSASANSASNAVEFKGMTRDNAMADAIRDEMDKILNTEV